MKKTILLLLVLSFLLSAFSTFGIIASAELTKADALDGYENICLTYTFDYYAGGDRGAHTEEDLLPYVGFYDREGKLTDYFFDSYLFLPCVSFGPSGGSMVGSFDNPSDFEDWFAYINDTFKEGYNVDALDSAFGKVKNELGDTSDRKAGVFFTILYPIHTQTEFGTINGENLDFSNNEDRKKAVKWIIDEQISLYNDGGYENLDMVGFYWFEEYLFNYEYTQKDIELFNYAADYLHSLGLKFIWIPWYNANGTANWDKLGFDVVCMQPNLFWMDNPDYKRVQTSIGYSEQYGMCMEMEIDPLAFYSAEHFKRYLIYLEDGMKYGAMDSIKMYYQDKSPAVFYQACNSTEFKKRSIYELTYKYAKGTLTEADINAVREGRYPDQPPVNESENLGDVNIDGVINQYDYVLVKRHLFGTRTLSGEESKRADVNKDSVIDQYDYLLIARHYFGTYTINS